MSSKKPSSRSKASKESSEESTSDESSSSSSNLSQVIQDIEQNIRMRGKTRPFSYLNEVNGMFELYRVQDQYYIVTCIEPNYLMINPLDTFDHFENVSRIGRRNQHIPETFPRSLMYAMANENKFNLITKHMVDDPNPKSTKVRSLSKLSPRELFAKITETMSQSQEYADEDKVPQLQVSTTANNDFKLQIEQVSGQPLDPLNQEKGYMKILQDVCHDVKFGEQQVGKFWLYTVQKETTLRQFYKKFFLVTCTEPGCFSINPLENIDYFPFIMLQKCDYSEDEVRNKIMSARNKSLLFRNHSNGHVLVTSQEKHGKYNPSRKRVIGVNLLNLATQEKLLSLVSQVTDPKYNVTFTFSTDSRNQTNFIQEHFIKDELMQLYDSMCRVLLVPSIPEDRFKLEFWTRLLEPLDLGQALKLQTSSDLWIREAIWQTKWMFSQYELKSLIKKVSKNQNTHTAYNIMILIRHWIPHVRYFVLNQVPEDDIFTAIYLFVVTHSPRLVRLQLQYSMAKLRIISQIQILRDYTFEILQKTTNAILPVSEIILPRDILPAVVPTISIMPQQRLLRWISLVGGASCITRLEWPDLLHCFTAEQPIYFPNLRSLSLIYHENTYPLAESFTKKNPTIVELDVLWKTKTSDKLCRFFSNFLKPIQTTLRKFRLNFEWILKKVDVQIAVNALTDFNEWQVDNVVYLELGLSNIPNEILSLITVGLTSVSRLRTLVLYFGQAKLLQFPVPFSNKMAEDGRVLENLVFNFQGSQSSWFKNVTKLINLINGGDDQAKLPVRNLTICDMKSSEMSSSLLQVALTTDCIVHSTVQCNGPMSYYPKETTWTDMKPADTIFNRLVLRCKNHPWIRQAFLFMKRKALANRNHNDLQNNGALFYIDYKKVVKAEDKMRMNNDMKEYSLMFCKCYFRFH